MRINMKIEGLDEVIRNLARVNVKRDFVDGANRSVAEVQRRALVEVPVDTSQLQKSHILSPATMNTAMAEVYTEKEYAVPVHEGHRIVAWGRPTGRRQPPNPWFKRAVDKSERKVNEIFDQIADKIANEITK